MILFSERRLLARYPDGALPSSPWPRIQTLAPALRTQAPLIWEERKFVALSHADLQGVSRELAAVREKIIQLDLELTCVPSRGQEPNAILDIRAEKKDWLHEEAKLQKEQDHILSMLRLYGEE